MSTKTHHTHSLPPMQEVDLNDAAWNEVVSARLPADLEAQARQLKAWTRQRGLRCVSDLLRALLVYACCQYSFRELGMWAVLKGIGSLSERAWRKRLDRARSWIATRFKTPAGTGDDVRLHQSYDLRAGRMEQVQLTDRHQAESLSHFELRAGDLVVTDAGYAVGSSVEQTQESKSLLLQRTAASQLHLEDEQGHTINLKARIKHVAANCLKEVVGWVDLPASGERAQVRVLCYRLPTEQAKKARERKAARLRKKHGPTYNQELVWWAGWVILVTTTDPAQWSGKELVALYRARWHIELFFKRLKQCLQLHQLRHQDWERASSVVQLYLLVWWLQEQEAQWMREVLTSVLEPLAEDVCEGSESEGEGEPEEEQEWVLSSWTLAHMCGEQVRTMRALSRTQSGGFPWRCKFIDRAITALLRSLPFHEETAASHSSHSAGRRQSRWPAQASHGTLATSAKMRQSP